MSTATNVLVLTYDLQFLDIRPLERAVRLVILGKAEVKHRHGSWRTGTGIYTLPCVIAMLYKVVNGRMRAAKKPVELTKKNVLLRDDYICQYCRRDVDAREATVDHVLPKSKGGPSTWENLVCCCNPCNQHKRNRTPSQAGMSLAKDPVRPSSISFKRVRKHTSPGEWIRYLTMYGISIDQVC